MTPGDAAYAEVLTPGQRSIKRALDLGIGGIALIVSSPVAIIAWVAATVDTDRNGLFRQTRIGRRGAPFEVWKIRTMRVDGGGTVTTADDARVTRLGRRLRRFKIDELPQLVNVVRGQMSLVGPRPDVPGFADRLGGADRIVLAVRPGITSPAAIAFRHEELILAGVSDPETYNREVIWPAKVRLNREYVESWTLLTDLRCLWDTARIVVGRRQSSERMPM